MKSILITEDDRFMANVCRQKFEEAGYQVTLAHDGHEALAQLVSHPPDIVMLDLMIPEIDGLGVLRFLRSRAELRELPVVVSNCDYFSGVVQAAWKAGATHFLNKGTCSPNSLVDEVSRVLARNGAPVPVPSRSEYEPPPLPQRPAARVAAGPVRVLVADDDKTIHAVLNFFLTQAGFIVRSASDGRQALEMARGEAPDILVLDGLMPELNGFEVLDQWQKQPVLADVPVIMLTGQSNPAAKAVALSRGVLEYLTKPFSPDDLVALIHKHVGRTA